MAQKETILIELDFDVSDFTSSAAKLNGEIAKLNKQQKELKKSGDEGSITYQENTQALKENKKELAETNKVISNLTTANKANAGSNEQMKAQLSVLTLEYNKLGKEQRTTGDRGKELKAQIIQTTESLKKNEEAVGNNRRSVGDYERGTDVLNSQLASLRAEFKNLTEEEKKNEKQGGFLIAQIEDTQKQLKKTEKEFDEYIQVIGESEEANDEAKDSVGGFGNALESTKFGGFISGIKATGKAFLANPIGIIVLAIVSALALLKEAFSRNESNSKKLNKITGALAGVFNLLLSAIEPLANFIVDVVISAFEDLGKAADAAIGLVSKGLDLLGFDEAAKSVDTWSESISTATAESEKLADAEFELVKSQRSLRILQLDFLKDAEKQRQIRDDESLSISKRIAANNKLGEILKEQSKQELAIANQALSIANQRIEIEGASSDNLDERASALEEIADINERITGQESEQLTNINSLKRDQVALNKEASDKKIALSEKEAAEEKRIAEEKMDAAVANAQTELDIILDANQSKIEAGKFLNAELFAQEQERLASSKAAQIAFEAEKLAVGTTTQKEFNDAVNVINEENRVLNEELEAERVEAEKEKSIEDLETQREIDILNRKDKFDLMKEDLDRQKEQELESAERTGADTQKINEKFKLLDKKLNQEKFASKLALASQSFGNLAEIAGRESKAGKAFAIAQTTIDTFTGAQAAFNSLAVIPIVGTVLGAIAAGAAVATGISRVNKIRSTKVPKAAKGGIFGGNLHSGGGNRGVFEDGTQIEVERDEAFVVINRNSTAMMNNLSNLNVAGGGVDFSNGRASGGSGFEDGGIAIEGISSSVNSEESAAILVLNAIESMPAPVVVVQDINDVQGDVAAVVDGAII